MQQSTSNRNYIITLIVTLFNPSDYDIDYWLRIDKILKDNNKIDIIFANDNPNRNDEFLKRFKRSNYVHFDENLGKYSLVYRLFEERLINSKWIKICDPDDFIDITNLNKFTQEAEFLSLDLLIKTPRYKVEKDFMPNGSLTISQKKVSIEFLGFMANYNSIFSRKVFFGDFFPGIKLSKSSDILFLLNSNLKKQKIYNLDYSFYIYKTNNGISNYNNTSKDSDITLVKESILYLETINKFKDYSNLPNPRFFNLK